MEIEMDAALILERIREAAGMAVIYSETTAAGMVTCHHGNRLSPTYYTLNGIKIGKAALIKKMKDAAKR